MGTWDIIEAGTITHDDLLPLLVAPSSMPDNWHEWAPVEAAAFIKSRICPEILVEELDWHIREIQHVNRTRTRVLRLPIIGRIIRDQHEINRLILISMEKSLGLAEAVESEVGRLFSRLRSEERSHWVQHFQYLGKRWTVVKRSIQAIRDEWESGRHASHRVRSKAGQETLNPPIEEGLQSLAEISSTLAEIIDGEVLSNRLVIRRKSDAPAVEMTPLEAHVESGIWHSREGPAIRRKRRRWPALLRKCLDEQRLLNRIYMISLEENAFVLKELAHRIGHIRFHMETSTHLLP